MAMSNPTDDVTKEMTSARNVKEDVALMMAPYMNYEQFLVPAPTSICVLGKLMLVSCQADFDLSAQPPQGGFMYLRRPESFRACLVQVSNDGYEALSKAHSKMDKIRLETLGTPDILKNALDYLFNGTPDEIEDDLPIELDAMKNSAEDCLRYAQETEKAFDQVMLVTAELLEASASAQGQYNKQLQETGMRLKIAAMQKEKLEKEEEMTLEYKKKLEDAMDKAEETYYKALDDIPTAWGLVGMQAAENISNTVSGVLNCATFGVAAKLMAAESAAVKGANIAVQNMKGIGNLATKVGGIFKGQPEGQPQAGGQGGQGQKEDFVTVMDNELTTTYARVMKAQSMAQYLYNTFVRKDDASLNPSFTKDSKDQIQQFEQEYRVIRVEIENYKNDLAWKLYALCNGWITICEELGQVVTTGTFDPQTGKDLAERMTDYHQRAMAVSAQAEAIMNNAQFDIKPPIMMETVTNSAGSDGEERAAKDLATENAKLKLALSTETYKHTQQMYDKACQRVQDTSAELRKFMAETEELDMRRIDFEKIRETLRRGMVAFAELRDQWSKMVQFFKMTSNIIEVCLNKSVKKLTAKAEVAAKRGLAGYSIDGLRKDMIYKQAFQAAKISYTINMIATSYVQVSQAHVMHRIAGLARLVSYNPDTDQALIKQEMSKLSNGYKHAQDEIIDIVRKNQRDFDQRIEGRLRTITRGLPASPRTDRLQAAVKEGAASGRKAMRESFEGEGNPGGNTSGEVLYTRENTQKPKRRNVDNLV